MANNITVSVQVNATVEKVWQLFMDPDTLQHWLTGFVSIAHLKGTIGQPGSKSRLEFLENGKKIEIIETVLSVRPLQQYTFLMQHTAFSAEVEVRFNPVGPMTEIVQSVTLAPIGFFMKLLSPFIQTAMKKRMNSEMLRLKAYIEQSLQLQQLQ